MSVLLSLFIKPRVQSFKRFTCYSTRLLTIQTVTRLLNVEDQLSLTFYRCVPALKVFFCPCASVTQDTQFLIIFIRYKYRHYELHAGHLNKDLTCTHDS